MCFTFEEEVVLSHPAVMFPRFFLSKIELLVLIQSFFPNSWNRKPIWKRCWTRCATTTATVSRASSVSPPSYPAPQSWIFQRRAALLLAGSGWHFGWWKNSFFKLQQFFHFMHTIYMFCGRFFESFLYASNFRSIMQIFSRIKSASWRWAQSSVATAATGRIAFPRNNF